MGAMGETVSTMLKKMIEEAADKAIDYYCLFNFTAFKYYRGKEDAFKEVLNILTEQEQNKNE